MIGGRRMRRWIAAMAMLAAGLALGVSARAADAIEVQKIVLAERDLKPGQEQLVQVSLRNTSSRPAPAGLRLELRDEKDKRLGNVQERKVLVAPLDEAREFFRFAVPRRQGKFTVRMELLTPDFKSQLLSGAPVFFSPFTVLGGPEPAPPPTAAVLDPDAAKRPAPPSFSPPAGLRFERPDLIWENVTLTPASLMVGEPLRITADLRNVGGDIARTAEVAVEYFNARNPARRFPVTRSSVLILAPGEKIEMEFEAVFPDDSNLGDYRVVLTVDPNNALEESNKENNVLVVESPIRLNLIRQIFPEANFVFDDAGLFLFRWDSRKYDEFKVQVGIDTDFANAENYFDMPQGAKWTTDHEIVPLEGELPDMALGLMDRAKSPSLYWRVLARESKTSKTATSTALPFLIRLPAKGETRAAAPAAQGAPTRPTPAVQSAPTRPATPSAPPRPAPREQKGSPPAPPPAERR